VACDLRGSFCWDVVTPRRYAARSTRIRDRVQRSVHGVCGGQASKRRRHALSASSADRIDGPNTTLLRPFDTAAHEVVEIHGQLRSVLGSRPLVEILRCVDDVTIAADCVEVGRSLARVTGRVCTLIRHAVEVLLLLDAPM